MLMCVPTNYHCNIFERINLENFHSQTLIQWELFFKHIKLLHLLGKKLLGVKDAA